MPNEFTFIRLIGAAVLTMGLSACATGPRWKAGDSLDLVQAGMGTPTLACPDGAQGERRVVWSQQPYGQQAWVARVAPDGRLLAMEQVLTDASFARLAEGHWTAERLRCHFGPPAEIERVGPPSLRQLVWSYRYRQEGVWNSLMHVYLGPEGDRVTRFHPGRDPLYERDRWLP